MNLSSRLLFLVVTTAITCSGLNAQNTVRIFNTNLKVTDIIGTTNLSTQKWIKDFDRVLVKNEDYYLKTIGSYRNTFDDVDPNSLFNLIDKGSYPLLDEINMRYYEEVVLPNLKSDNAVKNRADFVKFCDEWDKLNKYQERKNLLFQTEFIEIAKIIQKKRFSITQAPYTLKKEVTKKLSANVSADIKADLEANNIKVTGSVLSYLSSVVNSQTTYSGVMMVVEFEDQYMTRMKNALNGLSKLKIGTDDFSIGLKDYASPGSQRAATTGLVVFKLTGNINKASITEAGLKADIKARFSELADDKIASIATTISVGLVRKIETKFSAEIDNVYIKSLLTSEKIDDIEIAKIHTLFID